VHVLLKPARGNADAAGSNRFGENTVKPLGFFGPRGIDKARPPALAAISHKRELADDEYPPADFRYVEIHFALAVLEDTQGGNFVGQFAGFTFRITLGDREQHEKTFIDCPTNPAVDRYTRAADSLNTCSHFVS
jgi:hypothetical protein